MTTQERIFGKVMVGLIVAVIVFAVGSSATNAFKSRSISSLRFLSGVPGRGEAMTEFNLDY